MEKQITMALSEYEKLNAENERMNKILKQKELIPVQYISENMGMGYVRNSWNIATKDELVLKLLEEINRLKKEHDNAISELWTLRNEKREAKNKKWF